MPWPSEELARGIFCEWVARKRVAAGHLAQQKATPAGGKRLRELGIRIALGAGRREVLRASLGRAFRLLSIGSLLGIVVGIFFARVLSFIVYQASPKDPFVLIGVTATMLILGLIASWIPARRALAVDPLVLLREQ